MKTIFFTSFVILALSLNALARPVSSSVKIVIRKISGQDGQITEVCRKTLTAPVFQIAAKMPDSALPFPIIKCLSTIDDKDVTITVAPSALETNLPIDSKDLMLADFGGGAMKYFGGTLTLETAMQGPLMNGAGIAGKTPAKVFIALAPAPNNCTRSESIACDSVDQFTATLLFEN